MAQTKRETTAGAGTGFKPMGRPARLLVPCLTTAPHLLRPKPRGTKLRQGEPLVEPHPSLHHLPVSPADGVVDGLEQAWLGAGVSIPAVALATSIDSSQPVEFPPTESLGSAQLGEASLPQSIERFRMGGVWADRWSSPDLNAQLDRCLTRPVDTVVCNLLDLDPAVATQLRIAATWTDEIVAGVKALASLTGAGRSWLAIPEDIDSDLTERLTEAIRGSDIRLVPVVNRYPVSHPSMLLHALTHRVIRFGHLPVEQGAVIVDAAACKAVGDLLLFGKPMYEVPLAVFDQNQRRASYILAPIGTSYGSVVEWLGIGRNRQRLAAGSPLQERALTDHCVVGGGESTIYSAAAIPYQLQEPCIRCAWCIEACPVRIQPAALLEAAQIGDRRLADSFGLAACIECGICSVVCPSRLPLLQTIRILRDRSATPSADASGGSTARASSSAI